jgi:hypothetical protein
MATLLVNDFIIELVDATDTALAATVNNDRWTNAVTKAYDWLLTQDVVEYDRRTGVLLVPSATDHGVIFQANGVCQCKAAARGYPCWHRAAARLVRRALERQAAQVEKEVAELFA